MLKHIKNLLKANILSIAILVTIGIVFLSLIKVPKFEATVVHSDKWQHMIAYFILCFCWLLATYKKSSTKYFIVVGCILFGVLIEVLQHTITDYRTGDYLDVLANSLGVLLGLVVFNQILKKYLVN